MPKHKFVMPLLAATASVVSAGPSHGAITVVTSLAAFNAATFASGTDGFDGLSITTPTASPTFRTAGPYGYTATARGPGGPNFVNFTGAGTAADPWLRPNTAIGAIGFDTFTGFPASGIKGIGGQFFTSNLNRDYQLGDIRLTVADSLGATVSLDITATTVETFRGFITDGVITSLDLSSSLTSGLFNLFPTVDNLVLAVPEPATYALMLAGLAAVGAIARCRKA